MLSDQMENPARAQERQYQDFQTQLLEQQQQQQKEQQLEWQSQGQNEIAARLGMPLNTLRLRVLARSRDSQRDPREPR